MFRRPFRPPHCSSMVRLPLHLHQSGKLGYSNDMHTARYGALKVGRKFTIGYSTPQEGAVFAVDNLVMHKSGRRPEIAENRAIFPGPEQLAKMQQLHELTRAERRLLNRMWIEIKVR